MEGESKDTEDQKSKTLVLFLVSHLGDKWQVASLNLPEALFPHLSNGVNNTIILMRITETVNVE